MHPITDSDYDFVKILRERNVYAFFLHVSHSNLYYEIVSSTLFFSLSL